MSDKKGGISILGVLFLAILVVLALNYFHISITVENPNTRENAGVVGGATESLWTKYFQKPIEYLWNDIWIPYFWQPFIDVITKLRNGESIDMQLGSPTVPY